MQRPGYERFALVSNPFHDLASESLEQIEVFHVLQEADDAFERMKQEVLEKSRKAFVMVLGPLGSGKTQRLRVTAHQAEMVEAYAQYLNLGEAPRTRWRPLRRSSWRASTTGSSRGGSRRPNGRRTSRPSPRARTSTPRRRVARWRKH